MLILTIPKNINFTVCHMKCLSQIHQTFCNLLWKSFSFSVVLIKNCHLLLTVQVVHNIFLSFFDQYDKCMRKVNRYTIASIQYLSLSTVNQPLVFSTSVSPLLNNSQCEVPQSLPCLTAASVKYLSLSIVTQQLVFGTSISLF